MSLSFIGNNEQVLGDVLRFLDTNSRQHLRMQSSRLNSLIAADSTTFNVQLEMVQIRGNNSNSSAAFNCKVLPVHGAPQTANFDRLDTAVDYLEPLLRRSCIRLMNIQYMDLNPHNLQQLSRLVECSIRDISITGCNFFECTQDAFMDVFMRGALRSARYNIACLKNLLADVFDDRFISSLPALDIKMLTINFCSFADADTDTPTRYLQISDSCLLDWILVDAVGPQEQRNLSLTDMNLGRDFAARAHERFLALSSPQLVLLIVSGDCEQGPIDGVASLDRKRAPCARIRHPNGRVHLRIGNYSRDRVEFAVCANGTDFDGQEEME